jgi:hypothetical protein
MNLDVSYICMRLMYSVACLAWCRREYGVQFAVILARSGDPVPYETCTAKEARRNVKAAEEIS